MKLLQASVLPCHIGDASPSNRMGIPDIPPSSPGLIVTTACPGVGGLPACYIVSPSDNMYEANCYIASFPGPWRRRRRKGLVSAVFASG